MAGGTPNLTSTELLDRTYGLMARSRLLTRLALHVRGISTAILGKRLAPTTIASLNGEYWLLMRLAGDVRVAVDAGANVGEWSEHAISSWPLLERLVCFEPVGWAADEVEQRIGVDPRVEVLRRALSDSAGELVIWEEQTGGTMSSAVPGYSAPSASPARVEAVTLDEELPRLGVDHVDYLKIDVEGFDLHVLRGAQQLLSGQRIGVVQFEYSDAWQQAGSTLHAAFALLGEAGYRVLLLTPGGLRAFPLEETSELYSYANFVALLPSLANRFEPIETIW